MSKSPLNQLQNPVQPDIRRSGPRYYHARKNQKLDVGAIMREQEYNTQAFEGAILAVSRNNQAPYGMSTHREIVTAEFRPPTVMMYENYAHHRIPATVNAIVPRVNPGARDGYKHQNGTLADIDSHLTDRIGAAGARPTFYAPQRGSRPAEDPGIVLTENGPSVSVSAGMVTGYTREGYNAMEDMDLLDVNPQVAVSARKTTHATMNGYNAMEDLELEDLNPSVSVSAGKTTHATREGYNAMEDMELEDLNPSVSVTARGNVSMRIDGRNGMEDMVLHNQTGRQQVLHARPTSNFKKINNRHTDSFIEDHIKDGLNISYATRQTSRFRVHGGQLMDRPQVQGKIIPRSYGQINQTGSGYGRMGSMQTTSLMSRQLQMNGLKPRIRQQRRLRFRHS